MRRTLLTVTLVVASLASWSAAASAHRPPTQAEFRAIRQAIDKAQRHFYCANAGAVDVSTRDPHWASAFAISNCGSGSTAARFYLRRPSTSRQGWRVVTATSVHGIANRPACAGPRVPRDIRCGVRGRS